MTLNLRLVLTLIILIKAKEVRATKKVNSDSSVTPMNNNCSHDPFISSAPYADKVYLHPLQMSERRGDWYYNREYCARNCAEMVTIHSEAENNFFLSFMRNVGMVRPGAWLGAQIEDTKDIYQWNNEEIFNYSVKAPGEYNEPGITCLKLGYDTDKNWWRNFYCTGMNTNEHFIACQRSVALALRPVSPTTSSPTTSNTSSSSPTTSTLNLNLSISVDISIPSRSRKRKSRNKY